MKIFSVTAWIKGEALTLSAESERNASQVILKMKYGQIEDSITMKADFGKSIFSIQSNETTKALSCLLTCGVGLLGSVADCFKKSKNFDDFDNCLKSQSATLASGLLACIAGCFNS